MTEFREEGDLSPEEAAVMWDDDAELVEVVTAGLPFALIISAKEVPGPTTALSAARLICRPEIPTYHGQTLESVR